MSKVCVCVGGGGGGGGGLVFMKFTIYIHSEYIWHNKVFYILHLTH